MHVINNVVNNINIVDSYDKCGFGYFTFPLKYQIIIIYFPLSLQNNLLHLNVVLTSFSPTN